MLFPCAAPRELVALLALDRGQRKRGRGYGAHAGDERKLWILILLGTSSFLACGGAARPPRSMRLPTSEAMQVVMRRADRLLASFVQPAGGCPPGVSTGRKGPSLKLQLEKLRASGARDVASGYEAKHFGAEIRL